MTPKKMTNENNNNNSAPPPASADSAPAHAADDSTSADSAAARSESAHIADSAHAAESEDGDAGETGERETGESETGESGEGGESGSFVPEDFDAESDDFSAGSDDFSPRSEGFSDGEQKRNYPKGEKLQKILADSGAGSRREMEIAIAEGRVWVNGLVAKIGARVSPDDAIALDGREMDRNEGFRHQTLLYYKPTGEVVSRSENEGAPTIFANLPKPGFGRWINVGRLDLDSEGLILVTTDGEWAERLAHPRNGFEREYLVRAFGELSEDDVKLARGGVEVDGTPLTPTAFEAREKSGNGRNRWYRVVLTEGRNRAVRRLFSTLGCEVSRLLRVRFGPFVLPRDLRPGEWRVAPGLEAFSAAAPARMEKERGFGGRDRDNFRDRDNKGGRDFRDDKGGGWGRDRDDGPRGGGGGFRRDFDRPHFRDRDGGGGGGGGGFRDRKPFGDRDRGSRRRRRLWRRRRRRRFPRPQAVW